jgi:hypothetical protein
LSLQNESWQSVRENTGPEKVPINQPDKEEDNNDDRKRKGNCFEHIFSLPRVPELVKSHRHFPYMY